MGVRLNETFSTKKSDVTKDEKYILSVTVHVGFLAGSIKIEKRQRCMRHKNTLKWTSVVNLLLVNKWY